ncbi:MAG: FAD:protein FMN transferase [Lachnospiraceae bacterium]|nr:FAD:protein FMN transferase [Lachnospiraceae bacterium]
MTVYDIEDGGYEEAEKVTDEFFSLCNKYEALLSGTKEGADIYNINHAHGKSVVCDDITIDVIKRGMEYSRIFEGDFDITIGGVTKLWDFKSDRPHIPSDEDIAEALKHTGCDNIILSGNTLSMKDPLCEIDIGAIAKGYIADRAAEFLEERGVKSAVISLGGNIVCIGEKKEGRKTKEFKIGIETPYSDMRKISGVIGMSDETAVTSGVYERFFEAEGRKYHHIIDPGTGYPVQTDLLSVTVVADKGKSADCDALATICILKGRDEGKRLLQEREGFEGLFIDIQSDRYATEGFDYEKR